MTEGPWSCFAYFFFGLMFLSYYFTPLALVLVNVLVLVRLDPATCHVKEALPNNLYDLYVIPEDGGEPFSEITELVVQNSTDDLKAGDELGCFFRIDPLEYGRSVTVQLHSDRKNVNVLGTVMVSLWFGAHLLITICCCLVWLQCKWKKESVTGSASESSFRTCESMSVTASRAESSFGTCVSLRESSEEV